MLQSFPSGYYSALKTWNIEYVGQAQCLLDLESHLGDVHNTSVEVGDHLADLETGCCHCQDVLIAGSSAAMETPHVSPSLSAVQGNKGRGSITMIEDKVPLPIQVHDQQARWNKPFRVNSSLAQGWSECGGASGIPPAFKPNRRGDH